MSLSIFKSILLSATRTISKNKLFSIINITGLAIGLTCCMLITVYLTREFSYDRHHKFSDRIYQVGSHSTKESEEYISGRTTFPVVATMKSEFPSIENYTRIIDAYQDDKTLLQYTEKNELRSYYETKGFFADSTFFEIFSYGFIEGDERNALSDPKSIVISSEIALKLFGKSPALGKVIHVNSNTNGENDFKVTGVFEPNNHASHIDARFFMSINGGAMGEWTRTITEMVNNNMFYSYLLLKPGADPLELSNMFDDFVKRHLGYALQTSGWKTKFFLTPLKDIHLHSTEGNVTPGGNLQYLYILLSIAIITILIACVNFMNLSTARSAKRSVEIGIRKVLGAERHSLIKQFLFEAIIIAMAAFILSICLTWLLVPVFENVSGLKFTFTAAQILTLGLSFITISLITGIASGLYPAFYLSSFQPSRVLKNKYSNSLSTISFRKILVVFQFVISVALIVSAISISRQLQFMRSKELGFENNSQLIIPLRTTISKNIYSTLKHKILSDPGVINAGATVYYPGIRNVTDWRLYRQGNSPDQTRSVYMNWIDNTYLQTLQVNLVAGRLFSPSFPGDTLNSLILNEQAIREFGFKSPHEAIGKNIAATRGNDEVLFPVVGVVRDFHFEGLHNSINPYGFLLNRDNDYSYFVVQLKSGESLMNISSIWASVNPDEPFDYSFLDQDFQKNYIAEERLATLIWYFTIVAIFISCMGLFGLTSFSVEQRTREIGMRKVLGASVTSIVTLLSKDFLKLVLISFGIAIPLAYYFVNNWLESFAYRISFSPGIILASCLLTLLIAFITISFQTIKAALSNPVEVLRTE